MRTQISEGADPADIAVMWQALPEVGGRLCWFMTTGRHQGLDEDGSSLSWQACNRFHFDLYRTSIRFGDLALVRWPIQCEGYCGRLPTRSRGLRSPEELGGRRRSETRRICLGPDPDASSV